MDVPGRNPTQVPVDLLDRILDGDYRYALSEALMFRNITRNATTVEWVEASQLVGRDLTGYTIYAYYANWEDSEWQCTSRAVEMVLHEQPGHCRLVLNETDEDEDLYETFYLTLFLEKEKLLLVR